METFRQTEFDQAVGSSVSFVQDNQSLSKEPNIIRGFHIQSPPHAQGKLVRCVRGEIFDVAVDVRRSSPNYGQWFSIMLSAENARQLWIPPGFLHGFRTIQPNSEIAYKCTAYYNRDSEVTIAWNDPDINVDWGTSNPVLSDKDRRGLAFGAFDSSF